ncbi:MAG: hypothetical protein KGI54_15750 [Pseudomonadota bacterium]|nr:hypothetical protein [Pseudomonadota bacterium]
MNTEPKTFPVAHTLRQLKRNRWADVAFQEIDYTGGDWRWHLSEQDQLMLWEANAKGLLTVAQRKVGENRYRVVAKTTLAWDRGARP